MKEIFIAGTLALALLTPQATQDQQVKQQTSQIPDAPKPQSPAIGQIAPGKATTPTNSGVTAIAPAQTDPNAVPSSLPSTPGMTASAEDDGPVPELPAPGEGVPAFTIRARVDFVEIPFTVKDSKGRLVPGLTWRDIRVYENGLRQQPRVFTVDPFPLSVALVIDQSLPFDTMTRVNNALGALQGAFTAYDEVAVFTYNNGAKMQTDFTKGDSPRLATVVERAKTTGREPIYYSSGPMARGIDINGGANDHTNPLTSGGPGSPQGVQQVQREAHTLNDAILEAAKATTRAGKGRRRIVYVISDGKEYGSKAKTKDVIKYLQTNKIAVFATLVGDSSVAGLGFLDRIHIPLTMRDNNLPAFTAATGGETYAEYRTKGIETSFAKIAEEVRTQYTIGYNTRESFIDGKFRKVEVRVLRPNLTVIAKDGYFPTAADARPPAVR